MRAPDPLPPTPQQVAEATREAMVKDDRASALLGMVVEAIGPGTSTLSMTVREDMLNGHDICHGGFIFALADSAFAYACNTFNVRTVASGVDINFIAPAHKGQVLTAHGHGRHQGGRAGVYDIEVKNEKDELIAVFRGRSSRIKGHFFEEA